MCLCICDRTGGMALLNLALARVQEPAVRKQHGVLRTNCIDCLDRTNVAQFAAGLSALGRQLVGLGLAAQPYLDPRSSAASHLMSMYESMGNTLARQVCPVL